MGSLDTIPLPDSSSPKLILAPASGSERIECFKINGSSWAGTLSLEQYLAREDHLSQQPLTKNGQITYWILTAADGQPGDRPIYSACETFRKLALVARRGSSKVEEVICHGIGSVFCRPEYRSRGYAARMMQELGKILDNGWQQEGSNKGLFSILYSDIGQKFYSRFGWKPYSSRHITFKPLAEAAYRATIHRLKLPATQDLTTEELANKICPQDVQQIISKLQVSHERSSEKTHVAIRPDYEHISWHHAREEFQSSVRGNPAPTTKGASVPLSGDRGAINPSLIWTRSYGNSPEHFTLHCLRLILPGPSLTTENSKLLDAVTALLLRAQYEATKWEMSTVEIWSPDPVTVEAARRLKSLEEQGHGTASGDPDEDIVTVREKESICSLRWRGGCESGGEADQVEWVDCEKYAWC